MVEGALMAGLSVVLIMAGALLPLIGMVILLFCGVPVTIVTVRQGSFVGGVSAVLTALLISILLGPLNGLAYGLQFLLIAWIFGWMFGHRKSAAKTLGAGVLASTVATVFLAVISFALMGFSLDTMRAEIDNYLNEMMVFYESSGMLTQMAAQGMTLEQLRATAESMLLVMLQLSPAIMVIFSAFSAVINYAVTTRVLKRLRIKIPRLPDPKRWSLPTNAIWALILVWALWLAEDYIHLSWLTLIAQNILLIFGALLFLQGISVSAYWFGFEKMSVGMKILTVAFLIFFFTGFLVACTLIGLGDLLFDFRKLRRKEPKKEEHVKKGT